MSPLFGDIIAKVKQAADDEINRWLSHGLPDVVDRGQGVENLTSQ